MKNNYGWLIAVGLLLFNPAHAEVNINISPWDLFAASSLIGLHPSFGDEGYVADIAANIANKLCKRRPHL